MKNATLAAVALLALVALAAQPARAKIQSSSLANVPSGVALSVELTVEEFKELEDERRCVKDRNRNRGYYFVPVEEGQSGVAFDRCEIGTCGWRAACAASRCVCVPVASLAVASASCQLPVASGQCQAPVRQCQFA